MLETARSEINCRPYDQPKMYRLSRRDRIPVNRLEWMDHQFDRTVILGTPSRYATDEAQQVDPLGNHVETTQPPN